MCIHALWQAHCCVGTQGRFHSHGHKSKLDWFYAIREKYELTIGAAGPGPSDDKEATVPNRVIRWTGTGLKYEADPRQAERFREEIEVDGDGVEGIATASTKLVQHQVADEVELPDDEHRGLGAPANDLAADRPDIVFAAKEIC